jgi:hypothetical protein
MYHEEERYFQLMVGYIGLRNGGGTFCNDKKAIPLRFATGGVRTLFRLKPSKHVLLHPVT